MTPYRPARAAGEAARLSAAPRRAIESRPASHRPRRAVRRAWPHGGVTSALVAAVSLGTVATTGFAASTEYRPVALPSSLSAVTGTALAVERADTPSSSPTKAAPSAVAPAASGATRMGDEVPDLRAQAAAAQRARIAAAERTRVQAAARAKAERERLRNLAVFAWPTAGGVSSGFGLRFHPILRVWRLHNGADIGGACGQEVRAAQDGRVVEVEPSGYNGGAGHFVRIDHGMINGSRIETAYLHLDKALVKVGQRVKKGDRIATVGSTGLSTACHLHLTLYKNGRGSDPLAYVKK